jgi:hypothetical protein
MKLLPILFLALLAAACTSPFLRISADVHGDVSTVSNGNSSIVVANGAYNVRATFAQPPHVPVYPPMIGSGAFIRIRRFDPEYSSEHPLGTVLDGEDAAIAASPGGFCYTARMKFTISSYEPARANPLRPGLVVSLQYGREKKPSEQRDLGPIPATVAEAIEFAGKAFVEGIRFQAVNQVHVETKPLVDLLEHAGQTHAGFRVDDYLAELAEKKPHAIEEPAPAAHEEGDAEEATPDE